MLLAVPNISEGRDQPTLDAIGAAFGPGLIHASADPDHHRSVFTVRGEPGALAETVADAARVAIERIDLAHHEGAHPRVGAIDVAPIVYLDLADRGAAIAEALDARRPARAELELPVFLYGALAGGRTRAELRSGGPEELQRRIDSGELAPDAGPEAPASDSRRRARRRPPAAGGVQRRDRPRHARRRPGRSPPASARAAAELPGVRALGLELARRGHRPGLDQHRGPRRRPRPAT